MNKLVAILFALTVFMFLSLPVQANNIEDNKNYQLVGEAELRVLFWTVYHSKLYTLDGQYRDQQVPVRLDITYQIDAKAADLIEKTKAEWDEQSLSHANQSSWLLSLAAIWPDIKEGDELSLEIDDAHVSTFYFNKQKQGVIIDKDFGTQFLAIWLSEKTSQPALRQTLLGIKK